MIVLDASAAVEVVLRTAPGRDLGPRLLAEESAHAPHLIDLEVAQALRRIVLRGNVDERRASLALADFDDLPVERYPHQLFLPRIWELRSNLTAYDAAYVALAEALSVPLWTFDGPLVRAAPPSVAVVDWSRR